MSQHGAGFYTSTTLTTPMRTTFSQPERVIKTEADGSETIQHFKTILYGQALPGNSKLGSPDLIQPAPHPTDKNQQIHSLTDPTGEYVITLHPDQILFDYRILFSYQPLMDLLAETWNGTALHAKNVLTRTIITHLDDLSPTLRAEFFKLVDSSSSTKEHLEQNLFHHDGQLRQERLALTILHYSTIMTTQEVTNVFKPLTKRIFEVNRFSKFSIKAIKWVWTMHEKAMEMCLSDEDLLMKRENLLDYKNIRIPTPLCVLPRVNPEEQVLPKYPLVYASGSVGEPMNKKKEPVQVQTTTVFEDQSVGASTELVPASNALFQTIPHVKSGDSAIPCNCVAHGNNIVTVQWPLGTMQLAKDYNGKCTQQVYVPYFIPAESDAYIKKVGYEYQAGNLGIGYYLSCTVPPEPLLRACADHPESGGSYIIQNNKTYLVKGEATIYPKGTSFESIPKSDTTLVGKDSDGLYRSYPVVYVSEANKAPAAPLVSPAPLIPPAPQVSPAPPAKTGPTPAPPAPPAPPAKTGPTPAPPAPPAPLAKTGIPPAKPVTSLGKRKYSNSHSAVTVKVAIGTVLKPDTAAYVLLHGNKKK